MAKSSDAVAIGNALKREPRISSESAKVPAISTDGSWRRVSMQNPSASRVVRPLEWLIKRIRDRLVVAGSGNPQLQFACRKAAIRFRSTREI